MYGAVGCEDTDRTRNYLQRLGVPFREVDVDQDRETGQFVKFINDGLRSTPTLVIGEGRRKLVLVEPSAKELVEALKEAGYQVSRGKQTP